MPQYNLVKIAKKLRKQLDDDRYRHTLGVMYTAAALAMRYNVNLNQTQAAGLLHDCAKCIPNDKKIKLCNKYHIEISGIEQTAPYLLHSKLGSYIAEHKYHIDDPQILHAITWHTTGKPEMTMLEKIIFLADYIEPMRNKAANLQEIRRIAFIDIDTAVYMTLRDTLAYLNHNTSQLDDMTAKAYDYYKELYEQKGKGNEHGR